jgi:hypothetical protein
MSPLVKGKKYLSKLVTALAKPNHWDVTLVMTLVWGLVFGPQILWHKAAFSCLASASLIFPRLRQDERLWFVVLCINLMYLIPNWFYLPNDFFLFTYWVLTIFLAISSKHYSILIRSAQLLIGLTFAFATLWKILAPDFLNGNLFHFHFLTNYYFSTLTEFFSTLSHTDVSINSSLLPGESFGEIEEGIFELLGDSSLHSVAQFISVGAALTEGSVAVLFIIPIKHFAKIRELALCFFMLTAYAILPVSSIGVLLSILGFAQSNSIWWKAFFVFMFFAMQLLFFRVDILFGR